MVPAGDPTTETVRKLGELLEEGDLVIDGGNSNWHEDKRRADELLEQGINYVDVGTSGGVWGLEVGYCMMVGGTDDGVEILAPDPRRARPAGRLAPLRPARRRPLREDGPQRRRVRDDAGLRRGLRAACTSRSSRSSCRRSPRCGTAARVVRSWLCELAEAAFKEEGNDLEDLKGHVSDSGEGRWTLVDAIDLETPMPVLSAALAARFYSRGEGEYTAKVLAALRNQFGGHAVERTSLGGDE